MRGQRGATLLSNGRMLTERARIGEVRATKMGENLVGLGVPADRVHVTWQREPDAPDGVNDPERRRVTITLDLTGSRPPPGAGCDRACLVGIAEQYLKALTARDPSSLPLAATVKFTENGTRLAIGDGLWKIKATLATRRDVFADATSGQVALWAVLDEGGAPVLLSARLKVEDRRITRSRRSWRARAATHCSHRSLCGRCRRSSSRCSTPDQRTPRDRMIAIADGYFDGIDKHDSKLVSSADRLQSLRERRADDESAGAAPTPRACATAVDRLTHIKGVPDRRYDVVDRRTRRGAEHGAVRHSGRRRRHAAA